MSTITMAQAPTAPALEKSTSERPITTDPFNGLPRDAPYGDFRDDLIRDGYAVVKGAIPRDRADSYADRMYTWLEEFNLGFDRNDITKRHADFLPVSVHPGQPLRLIC